MYSDELMELLLAEEEVPEELVHRGDRGRWSAAGAYAGVPGLGLSQQGRAAAAGRRSCATCPRRWTTRSRQGVRQQRPKTVPLVPDPEKPTVGMAFKIVEDPVRQADVHADLPGHASSRAARTINQRTGRKERFSRIVRMHADQREDIDAAAAGDIVAVLGVDCASGDTYAAEPNTARWRACSCPSR